jgi:hypothetical protein
LAQIWDNTRRIFETASAGAAEAESRVVITVGQDGGLRMFCDSDWAADCLAREYGARESYVVTRHGGSVRVEGRGQGQTCVLQSESPAAVARQLLSRNRGYLLTA